MKIISTMIVMFMTVSAMAQANSGAIRALDETSVAAIDAMMMAKATDMKQFIASGNTVTMATVRVLNDENTVYTFSRKQCTMGGIVGSHCLGGAELQVMVSIKQQGEKVTKTANSKVILYRGM